MTDEEINKIIQQHATITDQNLYGAIYMMMLAAVDAEREACLELVERRTIVDASKQERAGYLLAQEAIAAAIRARGNT